MMMNPDIFLKYATACDQKGHRAAAAKAREVHVLAVEAEAAINAGKIYEGFAALAKLQRMAKDMGVKL